MLLVEDNPLNLELAREVLQASGYTVLEAGTGGEGLKLAAEARPDLVLLDIRLPDIDGLEVMRRLRADPGTSDLVVVALTAQAMLGDERSAREAGFSGYITKPINTRTFPQQVRHYLPRKPETA